MKQNKKQSALGASAQKSRLAFHADLSKLLLVEMAIVLLFLIFIVFYLFSGPILEQNFRVVSDTRWDMAANDIMESWNYRGHQPPQHFPDELLVGKNGEFISSQEVKHPDLGSLKYVSFLSSLSVAELSSYYRRYLAKRAFVKVDENFSQDTHEIKARRSKISINLKLQPSSGGSLVAIYYRGER